MAALELNSPWAARSTEVSCAMQSAIKGGASNPFYVVDLQAALDKLALWKAHLPMVQAHYAIKCNPDPAILLALAKDGACFDCASAGEIDMVLALGCDPSRIVYAHPIKQPSHLAHARDTGVSLTVFDSESELHKIAAVYPSCKLLLRIAPDDSSSEHPLSVKYGAQPTEAASLLQAAANLGLDVVGVSFHVGSGNKDGSAFYAAVASAADVFDLAAARGRPMRLLDIGGGFMGEYTTDEFARVAGAIKSSLSEFFPREPTSKRGGVHVIAEPGRYFACTTHHLAVNIIGKKTRQGATKSHLKTTEAMTEAHQNPKTTEAHQMYYINDGTYGSFNCVMFDYANCSPKCDVIFKSGEAQATGSETSPLEPSSLWGPTCDSIDCVLPDVELPELNLGDWLAFRNMGAYTSCAASNFNGAPQT